MNITAHRRWGGKHDVWLKYFGGSYSVRGWPLPDRGTYSSSRQSFRFGHEYVHATLELRKDIIPKFATSYKIETGLSVVGFVDAGLIASDWSRLPDQQLMAGTGFGIRIPFPLIDVIRLDLGWGFRQGKWNSPALHWGIAQKF
jgi:outer membrane protein assembly factor BamA